MRKPDSELWAGDADFAGVACPACGSEHVTVQSLFGSSASEVMFRCAPCKTVFNWIKWRGALPPTALDRADDD